ncbi:hypothetical protein [Crateriforma conspicua]|uniref:Chromosome partition protein Smc n=1 Tax=Crateriforma conspicua TaxID=2527996 RepID=A0A5C5Y6J7_9PLAN|nr:hypothetical protein [Crateriforma conspicua]TWT70774.1 hypothetical protein Pan14r_30820 [Crateriforma conspicua]
MNRIPIRIAAYLSFCILLAAQGHAQESDSVPIYIDSIKSDSKTSLSQQLVPDPLASDLDSEIKKAELLMKLKQDELQAAQSAGALVDKKMQNFETKRSEAFASHDKRRQALLDRLRDIEDEIAQNDPVGSPMGNVIQSAKNNLQSHDQAKKKLDESFDSMLLELRQDETQSRLALRQAETELEFAKLQLASVKKEADRRKKTSGTAAKKPEKDAPPEVLSDVDLAQEDLADCRMHIVGLYRAADDRSSDEVFVDVKPLDHPSVIVVSSYMEVLWRIRIAKDSDVKLVIATGYFAQDLTLTTDSKQVPVLNLSYFRQDKQPQRRGLWAYAYSWTTDEGRKMARMLYDITGLTASSFQGMESARLVQIDGVRGKLTNRQAKEPIPGLLTDAERMAEPVEFPDEADASDSPPGKVESDIDELYAAEASAKIAIRKTQDKVAEIREQLENIDTEIGDLTRQLTGSGKQDPATVDQLRQAVRKQFQLRQQEQEQRVQTAGMKLQLVEIRRMLRQRDEDTIVDRTVEAILDRRKKP